MRKMGWYVLLGAGITLFSLSAFAGSDAGFPKGWETWPVQHSGVIPGSDTPISADLPPIVQETIKTYNWVQEGKGSHYNVRVNPDQMSPYHSRNGEFADASTAVLELVDIKVLLVTEHLLGEPIYGVYTYDGKDISNAHTSLHTGACKACHSGYGEACLYGVCSK